MKRIYSLFLAAALCFSLLTVAQSAELTDIPAEAAYADAVQWAVEQELLTVDKNGAFNPRAVCTRGQILELLWHQMGEPIPSLDRNRFLDVTPAMSCYNGVLWAYSKDITAGYSEDTFGTDDPCTHAQLITFLWRADGMPAVPNMGKLAVRYAGTYYADALKWAEYMGMLSTDEDSFAPSAAVTCAELAQYLYMKSMPLLIEEEAMSAAGQLAITVQPQSAESVGGMVTFTLQASGGKAPYSYAWESKSGTGTWFRVYDTSSNTLTKFPAASMITSGLYFRCTVIDAAGAKVTSDEVKVLSPGESYSSPSGTVEGSTVSNTPLTVSSQPADVRASAGNAVTFKVEISGGKAPYTYKWESKTNSTDWTRVYDSASNTLTKYPTLDMMKSGLRFRCTVTDSAGSAIISREAAVTVSDTESGGAQSTDAALRIFESPSDFVCKAGDPIQLSVGASCSDPEEYPLSYQWEIKVGSSDWKNVSGSTQLFFYEFIPTQSQLDQGLQVRCSVRTRSGAHRATSEAARITESGVSAKGTLQIVTQPQSTLSTNFSPGDPVSFTVEVSGGTAPYSYQWYLTDAIYFIDNIHGYIEITETPGGWATGYTSPRLTVPYAADMQETNMTFCCVITDAMCNTVVSQSAGFSDGHTGPIIMEQSRGDAFYPKLYDIVDETTTSDFRIEVAGGRAPYTYQWQYRPEGWADYIDFGPAESNWAWDYDTDTLTVIARPDFPFSDPSYYQSPLYRCKVTDADGKVTFSKAEYTLIYD